MASSASASFPQVPASDVQGALAAIEEHGGVVLLNAITPARAAALAEAALAAPNVIPGVKNWEARGMLLESATEFEELATHPSVLAVAHALLGGRSVAAPNAFAWPVEDQVHLMGCDALIAFPGSEYQFWHLDAPMSQIARPASHPRGHKERDPPSFPMGMQAVWMLTPFTKETGATRGIRGGHVNVKVPEATRGVAGSAPDGSQPNHFAGPPGSVAIFPSTLPHAAGANTSGAARVGVGCSYAPWYLGRLTMDLVPITPEAHARLTPAAQALTKHMLTWQTDFDQSTVRFDADAGTYVNVEPEEEEAADANGVAKAGKNRKKNRKKKERKRRKKSASSFADIELTPTVLTGVAFIVCGLALAVAAARRRT